ncbi:hypothetical protein BDY24DRAFT_29399 [Mrakia frigida]|uniref:uncharacterized protein n=1 Tax=Mrakia frigida TaxID=29902 RepID=UPI003FCC03B1
MLSSLSDLPLGAQNDVSEEVAVEQSLTELESSRMSGTDDTVSSSVLPALPIEVIERILKYTFLRRSKLTPSSDPYHLNGTTSLLRVSRGFRELCLPFFYRSITITRSSDWTTFFDPEHGIFVAGEDGRKRWNYVRELAIVFDVVPPFVNSYSQVQDSQHYLSPMTLPSNDHHLDVLCVLDRREDQADWRDREELRRLAENIKNQAVVRAQILHGLREDYKDDLGFSPASSGDLEDWIQDQVIGRSIDSEVRIRVENRTIDFIEQEHRTVVQELVQASYPSALRVAVDTIRNLFPDETEGRRMENTLLQIYQSPQPSTYRLNVGGLCRTVDVVQYQSGSRQIRLEGFEPTFLSSLALWIRTYGHLPDQGFTETLRTVSWSWLLPDGSLFVLHPPSPQGTIA